MGELMSESDLVARTRQLLTKLAECRCGHPSKYHTNGGAGECTEGNDRDWHCPCAEFASDDGYLPELLAALPALLADNERLTAEIERVSTIRDGAIEVGLAMTSERDIAITRADAAEARLTQLTQGAVTEYAHERGEFCYPAGSILETAIALTPHCGRLMQRAVGPWLPVAASVVSETGEKP